MSADFVDGPRPPHLTRRTVALIRVRRSVEVGRDLMAHAVLNRAWWAIPGAIVLAVAALFVTTAHLTVPTAFYVIF